MEEGMRGVYSQCHRGRYIWAAHTPAPIRRRSDSVRVYERVLCVWGVWQFYARTCAVPVGGRSLVARYSCSRVKDEESTAN